MARSVFCCKAIVVSTSLVLFGAGCMDMAGIERLREQAAGLHEDLAGRSLELEERLERTPPDDPMRADVEGALARTRAMEAAAEAARKQVELVIRRTTHPDEPLGQSVQMLSPLLPAPLHVPLALGAALAATLIRGAQLRRGMESIVQGLETAMSEDPQLRERFAAGAGTMRTIQTPLAKRVVDGVQRKRAARRGVST